MSQSANGHTVRALNTTLVMDAIRNAGPLSRADICRETSLSPAAVSTIVDGLIQAELVRELGHRQADVGRPGRLLTFTETAVSVGCHMDERDGIRIVLMNLAGDVVERWWLEYPSETLTPEAVAEMLEDYLAELAGRRPGTKVDGLGLAVPGIANVARGDVRWAPALGWRDVPLGSVVEARLGVPVVVDNDVNLALIGEVDRGAAAGVDSALMVDFMDGVGGAVLTRGELYRGRGAAGEIGYMVTEAPDPNADHRGFGVTERRVRRILTAECEARGLDVGRAETASLARMLMVHSGRLALSTEARDRLAAAASAALASGVALLDPEVVLLAGWIVALGDEFLGLVVQQLERLVPEAPTVRFAGLDNTGVVIGAALSARRKSQRAIELVRRSA